MESDPAVVEQVVEGDVDDVVLPITLGLRAGRMRLADGRLTYTRRRGRKVVFDAPAREFHSFARSHWGTGFHLWHGATRHRFVIDHPVLPTELGPGPLAGIAEDVSQLRQGLAKTARSRAEVDRWHDALVPVIAPSPPAGVDVRAPFSPKRFVLTALAACVGATAALVAAITAIVIATS